MGTLTGLSLLITDKVMTLLCAVDQQTERGLAASWADEDSRNSIQRQVTKDSRKTNMNVPTFISK